ncbi:uncharacterized protein LOC122368392 isoform X2 [Amphibalanus amphitrite]|uniref:uncharacterized protein LOC122366532 isoform X2 n=1 Tax=Amphibalanus amphitrite TaxID=1232801 RepID=UPI001C90964F|nr:uncharacterized protein LOC122366532 isoform X2 [Amphibalanus amphitrite]XP_043198226.1 uncharacterized protein LOC122368392 isoform X2 [Amphibalanus amphitrite]
MVAICIWLLVFMTTDQSLAIKCHECGQYSNEKGIIEACNRTQTSDADRKDCHHTSILCLKHVNGNRMVKMCTDFCKPYEVHGGTTYCCAMPDYCNAAPAAGGPPLLLLLLLLPLGRHLASLTAPIARRTKTQQ